MKVAADKLMSDICYSMNCTLRTLPFVVFYCWMFALHGAETLSFLDFHSEVSNDCLPCQHSFLIKDRLLLFAVSCFHLLPSFASVTLNLPNLHRTSLMWCLVSQTQVQVRIYALNNLITQYIPIYD